MSYKQALAKGRALVKLLNHVPREALLNTPGIGPKTAGKILALRETCSKNGRPVRVEDIVGALSAGTITKLTDDKAVLPLIKYATLCCKMFHNGGNLFQTPERVLSLDLGIHNSAYVLLDNNYTIREWKRLELGMPTPYNPGRCFQEVEKALQSFPTADLYIIEEQSHRNPSNKGFLGISVQLRALEAMVYALFRLTKQVPVHTLPANRVARYFNITSKRSSMKKKMAVECVKEMLSTDNPRTSPVGERLMVSSELLEYFEEESKKDDLCDCLLQAVAIMDWCRIAQPAELVL